MPSVLSIQRLGLWVSALLGVLYVVIMLSSLLLVGWLTTGSLEAVFLGIGWSTLAGFVIGFLVVVIVGFTVAGVFASLYNLVQIAIARSDWSKSMARSSQPNGAFARFWQARLLAACLVLPLLALIMLRALASLGVYLAAPGAATANKHDPGPHTQPVNLGSTINDAYREAEPSFTADGKTMYFNCNSGDLCISQRVGSPENGNWSPPERLGPPISTEYEEVEPVINPTGDKLYFTSTRPGGRLKGIPFLSPFVNVFRVANTLATARLGRSFFGGLGLSDVYVSYWADGAWSEPRNLKDAASEPPINTSFADHCLFFSADGDEAFWTSTRPGGFGSDDIWTSRLIDETWTEPENLGQNVNGPGSEHTSLPTPNGQALYVTATRSEGYGGEDIYITTRGIDKTWGSLANLGPLVNGPGDDRCPAWTPDLKLFLFDSVREGGFGARDIWWVHFKDVLGHPHSAMSAAAAPEGK